MSDWILPWIDFLRWEFVRVRAYEPGKEYNWVKNDTVKLTKLKKPLNKCRCTFWSDSAARLKSQEPWEIEETGEFLKDISWKEIPKNSNIHDLICTATWTGGLDVEEDANLVFPLDRFNELEKESYIGDLAPVVFSSHGTFRVNALLKDTVPKAIDRMKKLEIDAVVLLAV